VISTSICRAGTIDPGRWPDVAVAAGSPGRAAVARVLFGTAIIRLPVRVRLPDGSLHGAGGPAAPVMRLHRPQEFFRRLGASGLIGFGDRLRGARGRHRLGRAGHPGRPPRRHRPHDHDLP
jgi:hypothetical protein